MEGDSDEEGWLREGGMSFWYVLESSEGGVDSTKGVEADKVSYVGLTSLGRSITSSSMSESESKLGAKCWSWK